MDGKMKGDLFRGFYDFVIENYSEEELDNLLNSCALESDGAYTTIGYYPHEEMITLITQFSINQGIEKEYILKAFGRHMFTILAKSSLAFIDQQKDCFEFLSKVENEIHKGVKKIHTKANPPVLNPIEYGDGYLELEYSSHRNMELLALGLIQGAASYFNDEVEISFVRSDETNGSTVFYIKRLENT